MPNEVLERHGAAVEEQAGTECKIDTGGGGGEEELGGGGGGGGGGRGGGAMRSIPMCTSRL